MSHNKNIKVICYLLALFLISCNLGKNDKSPPAKHLTSANSKDNDFNSFFERFKTDSAFQKARIHFPLKYKISGDEGEADSTRLIVAKDWKFTKLFISNAGNLILKKIKKSPTEMDVRVQIEDTGFENEFTFLKENNRWFLYSVAENSD